MATADSVKNKIQGLISQANETTGKEDTDLTAAVGSLIAGFGKGGGFPELIYETDFIIDEIAAGTGIQPYLTISTGLSVDYILNDEVLVSVLTCSPDVEKLTGKSYVSKSIQPLVLQYTNADAPLMFLVSSKIAPDDTHQRTSEAQGVGMFIYDLADDLSTIDIRGRNNRITPVVGTYHLEIYRTGFDFSEEYN